MFGHMLKFFCCPEECAPLRVCSWWIHPVAGIFRSHSILPLVMLRFPGSSRLAGNGVLFGEHIVDEVLVPSSIYCFEVAKPIFVGSWYVMVTVTPNRKGVQGHSLQLCWAVRYKSRIAPVALWPEP